MASSALRAAHCMRKLLFNRSRAFTRQTLSCTSLSHDIILANDTIVKHHYSPPLQQVQLRYNSTNQAAKKVDPDTSSRAFEPRADRKSALDILDRVIVNFDRRCQTNGQVLERDFVKTFDLFTRAVAEANLGSKNDPELMSNISLYSTLLLRCCGELMFDTQPKVRELLAGNLWIFLKEKNLPIGMSHYNCLLKVMNDNDTVFDPQKILDEIKEHKLDPDRITYQRLIHQYCLQGNIAEATKLLETMKDCDMELNEATFASLITGYCKQEKPPTVVEIFDLMQSNGVEPGSKSYLAAIIAQADLFKRDPTSASEELAKIYDRVANDDVVFSINEQVDLLTHLGPLQESHERVAKFLAKTVNQLSGSVTMRYKMMSALLRAKQFETATSLFWSQHFDDRIHSFVGSYYVKAMARYAPTEFALSECSKLVERRWNLDAFYILFYHAAEGGQLDMLRASLKKIAEIDQMKIHYTWPLIAQAKNHEDVIRVLKEDLNPKMDYEDLTETFSQWVWPKFADDAPKLFQANKELNYDANLLAASFLSHCVKEGKIDNAVKFLSDIPEETEAAASSSNAPINNDADVSKFLNFLAEHTKNPELVKKAFSVYKNQRPSVKTLQPLVKVHLIRDDFNGALEEFLSIAKKYRVTPCRTELINYCLEHKDPENLQKIMNATTDIFGEQNALFDLAICCLRSNKLKQAQKIFASPGFRVRPSRVYQACRNISLHSSIQVLENFVHLCRDMYDIDQEYLYQQLIETYDRTSMPQRALNLWNIMQEEEFQPSKTSLVMMADLLEKHNLHVPFQKPGKYYQKEMAPNRRRANMQQERSRPIYMDSTRQN